MIAADFRTDRSLSASHTGPVETALRLCLPAFRPQGAGFLIGEETGNHAPTGVSQVGDDGFDQGVQYFTRTRQVRVALPSAGTGISQTALWADSFLWGWLS